MILMMMLAMVQSPPTPSRDLVCRTLSAPVSHASLMRKDVRTCKTKAEWKLIGRLQARNGTGRAAPGSR